MFAVIGPNGAGKSTLLNLISGVYQPDAGSLSFDGVDLVGMPAHRRVRLGIARTFQKIRLFKQLTVLENVIAGFHIHHDIPAWQYVVHGAAFAEDQRAAASEALRAAGFRRHVGARASARRLAVLRRAAHARDRARAGDQAAACCWSTSRRRA